MALEEVEILIISEEIYNGIEDELLKDSFNEIEIFGKKMYSTGIFQNDEFTFSLLYHEIYGEIQWDDVENEDQETFKKYKKLQKDYWNLWVKLKELPQDQWYIDSRQL